MREDQCQSLQIFRGWPHPHNLEDLLGQLAWPRRSSIQGHRHKKTSTDTSVEHCRVANRGILMSHILPNKHVPFNTTTMIKVHHCSASTFAQEETYPNNSISHNVDNHRPLTCLFDSTIPAQCYCFLHNE